MSAVTKRAAELAEDVPRFSKILTDRIEELGDVDWPLGESALAIITGNGGEPITSGQKSVVTRCARFCTALGLE